MKRLLVLSLIVACGPKPAPLPVPKLPGDGDANVAKPPPAPVHSADDDAWLGKTDLLVPPAPKKPAKMELPPLTDFKLANGLQVYVIESKRLPVVSMQLAVKAGRLQEPRARLGVSEATADMLVKGTSRHNAVALAKTIARCAGGSGKRARRSSARAPGCSLTATRVRWRPAATGQPWG